MIRVRNGRVCIKGKTETIVKDFVCLLDGINDITDIPNEVFLDLAKVMIGKTKDIEDAFEGVAIKKYKLKEDKKETSKTAKKSASKKEKQ